MEAAALMWTRGIERMTEYSGSTMNGSSTCVMATSVPVML